MPSPAKSVVLFLCTGNAARSQMAEALARLFHADVIDVSSAGSRPCGWVHPMAIRVMEELGADMSKARSKGASDLLDNPYDVVVTVCDSAAADCPNWPNARAVEHWPIEDPSWGSEDPDSMHARFVSTRDDLRSRIDSLAERLPAAEP